MAVLRKSKVKAFVKDEPYPMSDSDNKHPRAICSRSDEAKALYGVIFEGFNEALFHSKFSVKHRPAQEKAVEIEGRLPLRDNAFIQVNDYSSFESCQRAALMQACELSVYH